MTTNDLPNGGNRSVLVQTTLRVAETDDEIEIVSDRGIQTIASTIPTSDNQSFIPFLEFTPYSEIVKDSQKVLDLPRKAALQFNLENKTHKKSLSEINPKGVLKKSMSNTTLITDSDLLISQHIVPTMPKTKEEREIQTDLTVNPYILDEDTVANVCTQLSVQTSITFEPADSLSEITQALKKAIVHTKNCQAVVVDGKIVTNYVDPDMEKASKVTVSERLSTLTSKTDNTAITRAAKENVAEEQEETETPIDQEEKPPPKPVTHTVQTSVPVPLNMTEEEFEANVQRILDQTVRNVYEFMAKIVEMYEQSKDADGKYVETPLSKELRKQAMERRLTVDEADEEVEVSETPVVKDESENLENKPPPLAKSETAEDQPKKQPSTLDMVAGIIRGPKWIVQQTLNVDVKTGLPTPGKQQKIEEEPVEVGEEIAFDATATTIEFVPIDTDEAEKHFTPKKEPPKSEPEEGVVEGALGDTDQVQSQEKDESAEPIETGESTEAAKQEILPDQEKPEAEEEAGDTNVPSAVEDTTVDATQEEPQVEDVVGDENVLPTIDEEDVSTPQEATDAAAVEAPKEDEILQEEPKGDETPTGILEAERPETPPPSLVDLVESIGDSKVKPVADIPCECSRIHEAGAAPPSISQPAIRFEVTVLSDAKRKHEGAEGVIVQASVSRPDQDRATCKDMNINLSVTVGGQTFTPGDQLAIEGSSGIDIESCECPEDQDKEKFDQEEGQGSLPSASEDFEECICPEEESKPLTEEVPESEESKEEAEGETPTVTEEQTEAATEPLQEQVETYPEQAREAPKEEVEAATEEVTEPTEAKPDIAPTWKECQCETSELKPGTHMQTQTEIVAELPGEPSEKGEASAKHSIGSSFAECVCTESETQSEVVVDHPDEKVSTKSEPESFVECICSHSETKSSKVGSEKQSKVTISSPPSQPRAKPSGDQVVEKPEQSEKPSEVEIGPPTEYPDQTEVSIKEGSQKIKQESQEYLECGCRKTKSTSTIKKTVCICEDKSKTVKKESQEFLECGCRKQRPASPVKKPVCACADKPKPIPQESQEFLECGCRKQRPPSPIRNPICTCADTSKPVPPKESQEFLECGCKKMPKKSSLKESREILECTCRRRRSPSPPKESICTCKDKQEIGVPKMPSKSRSLGQKVCGCQTEQFPHQQPEELEKFRSEPITEQGLVDVGTCMGGDAPGPCKQKSAPLRAKESIPKKLNQTFSLPTQNVSTDYDTTEPATQKDICICPTPGKYDESIEEYIKKLISESITTRDPELIQTHAACIGPFLQKFAGKLGQQAEGVSGRPIKCTGDAEQQCSCSVQILYINDGNQPTDTAEKACTCAIPKEQVQQRQDAVEPVIAAKSCHCDIDNEPSPYLECMYQEDNDYSEMYMEELQSGDGFRLEKIESDKVTCECPDELPPVLMETDECRSNIEIPWLSIVLPPPGTIIIKPMREIKKVFIR